MHAWHTTSLWWNWSAQSPSPRRSTRSVFPRVMWRLGRSATSQVRVRYAVHVILFNLHDSHFILQLTHSIPLRNGTKQYARVQPSLFTCAPSPLHLPASALDDFFFRSTMVSLQTYNVKWNDISRPNQTIHFLFRVDLYFLETLKYIHWSCIPNFYEHNQKCTLQQHLNKS